jgi:hypothetical protein
VYEFIKLTKADREAAFRITSTHTGYPAHVMEKDFWVTYLLDTLFNRLTHTHRLMFKGGTSLSKCYNLIERFSEDIDLSLNMEDLGFGGEKAPHELLKTKSKREAEKAVELLKLAGEAFLKDSLLPMLSDQITADIGSAKEWSLSIDPNNPENILFHYPKTLNTSEYGDQYVKPVVLIESGTKAAHEPIERVEIKAFVEDAIAEIKTSCHVNVLSPKRTFWEKATILHAENNINKPKRVKERLSRHLYDLVMLYRSDIGKEAIKDIDLLAKVAEHKKFYFRSGAANYDDAKPGTLKIVPHDAILQAFKQDYEKMGSMFSGEILSFESIISELQELESSINTSPSE